MTDLVQLTEADATQPTGLTESQVEWPTTHIGSPLNIAATYSRSEAAWPLHVRRFQQVSGGCQFLTASRHGGSCHTLAMSIGRLIKWHAYRERAQLVGFGRPDLHAMTTAICWHHAEHSKWAARRSNLSP